jgi:hypothetical protein
MRKDVAEEDCVCAVWIKSRKEPLQVWLHKGKERSPEVEEENVRPMVGSKQRRLVKDETADEVQRSELSRQARGSFTPNSEVKKPKWSELSRLK